MLDYNEKFNPQFIRKNGRIQIIRLITFLSILLLLFHRTLDKHKIHYLKSIKLEFEHFEQEILAFI